MTEHSRDYHDYVFKDGRRVGDFEGMYRHSEDVPWRQDKTAYDISADVDIAILRRHRFRTICEVGSGLGYLAHRLRTELLTPDGGRPEVTGLDISPTAVAKAAARFPEIRFVLSDLLDEARLPPAPEKHDLVVAKDVLWYVCHELDRFLDRVVALADIPSANGMIHISQSFPNVEKWVGQDVIGSCEELLDHLRRHGVHVLYTCVERDIRWEGATALHVLGRVR